MFKKKQFLFSYILFEVNCMSKFLKNFSSSRTKLLCRYNVISNFGLKNNRKLGNICFRKRFRENFDF